MEKKIIRLPEVKSTVGLSTTTIYRLIKAGEFPAQIKLGQHASGWRESEVQAWIRARAGQPANDIQPKRSTTLNRATAAEPAITELIKTPLGTETLRPDEITRITGHRSENDQAKWLTDNRWVFHVNGRGEIIIGRMCARLRMCGIEPARVALAQCT
jgi:prophage regulatory protein